MDPDKCRFHMLCAARYVALRYVATGECQRLSAGIRHCYQGLAGTRSAAQRIAQRNASGNDALLYVEPGGRWRELKEGGRGRVSTGMDDIRGTTGENPFVWCSIVGLLNHPYRIDLIRLRHFRSIRPTLQLKVRLFFRLKLNASLSSMFCACSFLSSSLS